MIETSYSSLKCHHQLWAPNVAFFVIEHLKKVAIEKHKRLDITIGAYVTFFANHLNVDIQEEEVGGNPRINLKYLVDNHQLYTARQEGSRKLFIYARVATRLLGLICSIHSCRNADNLTNNLEGEPTEPKEDHQQANKDVPLSKESSRAKEGRSGRSERRIRSRTKSKPYEVST